MSHTKLFKILIEEENIFYILVIVWQLLFKSSTQAAVMPCYEESEAKCTDQESTVSICHKQDLNQALSDSKASALNCSP